MAFALIAEECTLLPAQKRTAIHCLVLKRQWLKKGTRKLSKCREHEHTHAAQLFTWKGFYRRSPSSFPKTAQRILGQQFASDLRTNMYAMSISDNHTLSHHPSGSRCEGILPICTYESRRGLHELYVLPWEMADASINCTDGRHTVLLAQGFAD